MIETRGYGPNREHFQRRRSYQRLNVVPWAYEDSYFIYRGEKHLVVNRTDNLVLKKQKDGFVSKGTFTTEILSLPPNFRFDRIHYEADTPADTTVTVNLLDTNGEPLESHLSDGAGLNVKQSVKLQFVLESSDRTRTPRLDSYSLSFARQ